MEQQRTLTPKLTERYTCKVLGPWRSSDMSLDAVIPITSYASGHEQYLSQYLYDLDYTVYYCRDIRAMDMSEILWYKLLGNWETSLEYTLDASRLCACLRYRLLGLWWPSLEYTWQSNNLCHTMYIYIVIVMCATVDASGSYVWSVIWLLGLWGPSLEYISHNQAVQYWYLS
jgi:hypothetical protein